MTKEKIKAVAMIHFARFGYEGASIHQIAKEVGIKTPSLYNHFQSKEEIFVSIFEEVNWKIIEQTREIIGRIEYDSTYDKLYNLLYGMLEFYIQNETLTLFLKRNMLLPPVMLKEKLNMKFLEAEALLSSVLTAIFTEGMEKGIIRPVSVETLLATYYCILDGMFMQIHYYGADETKIRLRHVWETMSQSIFVGQA